MRDPTHWLCAIGVALGAGCEADGGAHARDGHRFEIAVQVDSDPGKPLANVQLLQAGHELGRTSKQGSVRLALSGNTGDVTSLQVACPQGYNSPSKPISVTLRPLLGASAASVPRYRAQCQPLMRSLVVAVRAKGGPDLPVKYQGREVARTDSEGTAHVQLEVAPTEQVTLQLDTSKAEHELLRPRSPEFTLVMPARDNLAVFDQAFALAAPPAVKRGHVIKHLEVGPQKITRRP